MGKELKYTHLHLFIKGSFKMERETELDILNGLIMRNTMGNGSTDANMVVDSGGEQKGTNTLVSGTWGTHMGSGFTFGSMAIGMKGNSSYV